ncbi:MAG: prolyl oligopeptidase family serine peptidase [candidate division KSB1 bacterium]|nr:prolyl oligopeptidase family serine peptidase [candidate division KSB1 bacterium]MDZ7275914.1 prolyl oligopeptidase family serine peptidase [candidate division KSB1 bacterium]MDZ7285804.1 prolyl oligopeptidase family serine peptidase [candidate division KSB1 bacterium]MDZ7298836.1 prolyl oligopeptidase family serine peptidase [candidate division KSB1 bacterium]MDZ7308863.1 prolyl oligopeptidase family serine peptidase [candidate division KSB1 bacterium]
MTSWRMLTMMLLGSTSLTCAQDRQTGFLHRTLTIDGRDYCYQIFVPTAFTPARQWPVILFLHGAGERGTDCEQHTQVGIGPAIRRQLAAFSALVVLPQCRPDSVWIGAMEELALAALDKTLQEFNGDARRVYLTGLSMGGYGTWYLASRHPEKFAALAPVCGGIIPPPGRLLPLHARNLIPADRPYETIARKIGKTPVWIFHGEADPVIPVAESRAMTAALQALGGRVRYTEYPGVGHNAWDQAYADTAFWSWLFAQTRAN